MGRSNSQSLTPVLCILIIFGTLTAIAQAKKSDKDLKEVTHKVYFDIEIDGNPLDRTSQFEIMDQERCRFYSRAGSHVSLWESSSEDCRLDGRHVVFGKVLSGMDVAYKIEAEGRQSGTPKSKVVIADSGELPL